MILKILNIFLQNIRKNRLLTNTILENNNKNWYFIYSRTSLVYYLTSAMFFEWRRRKHYQCFSLFILGYVCMIDFRWQQISKSYYINIRLISLRFPLRKDILNHHNINLIFFFNHDIVCFILNIYSNDH